MSQDDLINAPVFGYAERPDLDKSVVLKMLEACRERHGIKMVMREGKQAGYHFFSKDIRAVRKVLQDRDEELLAVGAAGVTIKYSGPIFDDNIGEDRVVLRTRKEVHRLITEQGKYADELLAQIEELKKTSAAPAVALEDVEDMVAARKCAAKANRELAEVREELRKKTASRNTYYSTIKKTRRELADANTRVGLLEGIIDRLIQQMIDVGIKPRLRVSAGTTKTPANTTGSKPKKRKVA